MRKQSGNHSSKYALNPEQLEKDLQEKENERNTFKDLGFRDLISLLYELKQEFNL